MRTVVRQGWVAFTSRFEGVVPFMYLDILGKVTTAIGDLIDSVAEAQALPWVHIQGVIGAQYGAGGPLPASAAEVAAEWHYVKSRTDLSQRGGGAYGAITHLRLTDEGILAVVGRRLDAMDHNLAARYPYWEDLPAEAQTAVLSMCWAAGEHSAWPHFDAALAARDWATCAVQCHLDDAHNPGLKPRNVANRDLFLSLNQQNVALPASTEVGTSDTDEGTAA